MQQLLRRNTYLPTNTSFVCGSKISNINKDQSPSYPNSKTLNNNPEKNLRQHTDVSNLRVLNIVYVKNQRGKPLMPTNQSKARRLIKTGKAKVIKRFPFFTIQLLQATGETKQRIRFGIDPGYENIGLSAITDKKELVGLSVKLRTNVSKKVKERSMYRRNRRSKLWYRPKRFNNRGIPKGWLAPSVRHRFLSHIRLVNLICEYLPITEFSIEVANFDIQKINNPEIKGKEYQKGSLCGYENTKSYLVAREQGKCQLCSKESSKGNSFRIHHIIERSNGGTDRPDNLALLHEKCHEKLHTNNLGNKLIKNKQYKAETFMSIIRRRIVEELGKLLPTAVTYGYRTKIKRNEIDLEKSHSNDAFVIAEGDYQQRCKEVGWVQKQRNNRSIQQNRKGQKVSVRKERYKVQSKDLIWVNGKKFTSKGCQNKGTRIAYDDRGKNKTVKIENIDKFYNYGGFYPHLKEGDFAEG